MGNFQELRVWQEAKDLSIFIYKITRQGEFSKDFGLKDQIQRASVSVASNIAEGEELKTNRQANRFFFIARGSLAELITQTIIAFEIGYISDKTKFEIVDKAEKIMAMLNKLIKARGGWNK